MTELQEMQLKLRRCRDILDRGQHYYLTHALALSFGGTLSLKGLADVPLEVSRSIIECVPSHYTNRLDRQNKSFVITAFEKDPSIKRTDLMVLVQKADKVLPVVYAQMNKERV